MSLKSRVTWNCMLKIIKHLIAYSFDIGRHFSNISLIKRFHFYRECTVFPYICAYTLFQFSSALLCTVSYSALLCTYSKVVENLRLFLLLFPAFNFDEKWNDRTRNTKLWNVCVFINFRLIGANFGQGVYIHSW